MSQTLPCPHCGKSLKLLDGVVGKTIRCPSCQQTFQAPTPMSQQEVPEVLPGPGMKAATPVLQNEEA